MVVFHYGPTAPLLDSLRVRASSAQVSVSGFCKVFLFPFQFPHTRPVVGLKWRGSTHRSGLMPEEVVCRWRSVTFRALSCPARLLPVLSGGWAVVESSRICARLRRFSPFASVVTFSTPSRALILCGIYICVCVYGRVRMRNEECLLLTSFPCALPLRGQSSDGRLIGKWLHGYGEGLVARTRVGVEGCSRARLSSLVGACDVCVCCSFRCGTLHRHCTAA